MNNLLCRNVAARTLVLLFLIGQPLLASAQIDFTEGNDLVLQERIRAFLGPTDVDGDKDLDLFVVAATLVGPEFYTELYLNDGQGNFTIKPNTAFIDAYGPPAFADIDNDLDQDVILSGQTNTSSACVLYLNDGMGEFTAVENNPFPAISKNSVNFFHYDQDELIDVLIIGDVSGELKATIFRNEGGGNFSPLGAMGLPGFRYPATAISDLDGDGDEDVVMSGYTGLSMFGTYVFLNESGNFTLSKHLGLITGGEVELADFNMDGFPDIVITGAASYFTGDHIAEYWRNDGTGKFIKITDHPFEPASESNIEASDFDGDGDLDVFIGGVNTYSVNFIYVNDGEGNFSKNNYPFYGIRWGGTAVGNFDGESLDDVIIFGYTIEDRSTHNVLYLNNTIVNEPPIISGIQVSGELLLGKEVAVNYSYSDKEGGEDKSLFQWYRADNSSGLNKIKIEGANSTTYLMETQDAEMFLSVEVTPFDGTTKGNVNESEWVGPVKIPVPEIALKGNGLSIENGSFPSKQNFTDFGEVAVNGTITHKFLVENQGDAKLIISGISASGENSADFVLTEPETLNVLPGNSISFFVEFKPSGIGERSAMINISNNDGNNDLFSFQITGKGLNLPPNFISLPQSDFQENKREVVLDINASNGEGSDPDEGIIYSINGGDDSELFKINADNGYLTFIDSPDYEMPKDTNGDNIYIVEITADDQQAMSNIATQIIIVSVLNIDEPPTAVCKENIIITLDKDGVASISADQINNGSSDDSGNFEISIEPISFSCGNLGDNSVTLIVKDLNGQSASCISTVTVVDDIKPVIPSVDPLNYKTSAGNCWREIDITPPKATDNCGEIIAKGTRSDGFPLTDPFPIGETTITWEAEDNYGNKAELVYQKINVYNNSPSEIIITGPEGPRQINSDIIINASFDDENIAEATWIAFDGNEEVQKYTGTTNGGQTTHTFENLPVGIYTIILELKDHCGEIGVGYYEYIVIYDPSGGFVTGSGWFDSPEGAMEGSTISGKAHFGFNAKYKNGTNELAEVDGETNFQFKAGDLHFKSKSHERMSLVVSGGFKATYKGTGSINGLGEYKFLVTVIDAEETVNHSTDLFRIRIWSTEEVIYDNNLNTKEDNADPATAINGGSIVIHRPKGSSSTKSAKLVVVEETEVINELEIFTAYPNPMEGSAVIKFMLNSTSEGVLSLFDLNGREISRLFEGKVEKGEVYEIAIKGINLMKGTYFYRLSLETGQVLQKQLLVN